MSGRLPHRIAIRARVRVILIPRAGAADFFAVH